MSAYFEQVLTDGWKGIYREEYHLGSENFPGSAEPSWSISKYVLKGGKQHGVDVVELHNGHMTVVVVPTRGMGVREAFTSEMTLGWRSPVRSVVHPAYVDEESRGLLGWLEGFNELVCRCGLSYNGAPGEDVIRTNTGAEARVMLPLHGTIANAPAMRVVVRVGLDKPRELSVIGEVYDTQMFGSAYRLTATVSTVPGSSEFTISDTVENLSAMPSELELLYHCNFGLPLLGEGSRVLAPVEFVCPRDARAQEGIGSWDSYGPPQVGFAEQCYFLRLFGDAQGQTLVALTSPDEKAAATIRYSIRELPAFTLWKNTAAKQDGYVTGLEPGTDYPNSRRFERSKGRVMVIPGGGSYRAKLAIGLLTGVNELARVKKEVADLTAGRAPMVCHEPVPEYCPAAVGGEGQAGSDQGAREAR